MQKSLYSFYDVKTCTLTPPMVLTCSAEAERLIIQMFAQDAKIPIVQFPADFTLFKVADWDDEKGVIPLKAWENCGNVEVIFSSFRKSYSQVHENQNQEQASNADSADNPEV